MKNNLKKILVTVLMVSSIFQVFSVTTALAARPHSQCYGMCDFWFEGSTHDACYMWCIRNNEP